MGLSTHILDTALGRPAANVTLTLFQQTHDGWQEVGRGTTDTDGRCRTLLGEHTLEAATYKLHFAVADYFRAQKLTSLYPHIEITFTVVDPAQHYHIPLLLAANGYTTYRGS
ncbi:MAG TPA: hydroxyisourate hydrolase [Acidobacteriaceae bacterium]|jgi:5-hydroxyisourate hydrolase|nr:hydroxyisourate hydrolase [Acidobacteriaceae bacterium]